MPDIWSGIGTDITTHHEGEWLYKVKGQLRGPLPMQALAAKLVAGEIDVDTLVAREGSEFHEIARVAAFARHVTEARKAAAKRHAARNRRLTVILVVAGLAVAGIVGGLVWREMEHKRKVALLEAQKLEAKRAEDRKRADALREPELVALVSLGTQDTVKIRSTTPPPTAARKPTTRKPAAAAAQQTAADELAASCRLSQADIYGTLKRSLGLINVCVEDEKSRDTQGLLPSTLELEFVVQNSGRVTDFAVNDRHYAKGPLNNCLMKAFNAISFPTSNGTACPVTIPIKIGK